MSTKLFASDAAIFVALFVLFGAAICFVRPPYQLSDEANSFARVWQVSEGIFVSPVGTQDEVSRSLTGDNRKSFGWVNRSPEAATEKLFTANVPAALVPDEFMFDVRDDVSGFKFSFADMQKFLSTPLNVDVRETGLIPNTGAYAPPVYLPQAAAAFVGRKLNLSAGEIFYLVRLSALLFVATCLFWSMKLLPEARHVMFVLAMSPMFLTESGSASADAVTFGLSFLATAWLLSMRDRREKFSRAEVVGLILLSAWLACAKSVYGTILLLYFLLPRERGGSSAKFFALGALLLAVNLATSLLWTEFAFSSGAIPATSRQYLGVDFDVDAKKIFVVEHPLEILSMTVDTLEVGALYYLLSFIGVLGVNGDVFLPLPFYLPYIFGLTVLTLHGEFRPKVFERALMLFAVSVTTLAFFVAEFVIWTEPDAQFIRGVQGRYFLPLAPMFLCALTCRKPLRHPKLIAAVVGTFAAAVTIFALIDEFAC